MNRRTLPCLQTSCSGCAAQLAKRYEAYISVLTATEKVHAIYALTPAAADALYSHAPDATALRGLVITISRIGQRANGRLTLKIEDVDLGQIRLPDEPDLIDHMLNIWGLDRSFLAQDKPDQVNRIAAHFKQNGAHSGA